MHLFEPLELSILARAFDRPAPTSQEHEPVKRHAISIDTIAFGNLKHCFYS